MGDDSDCVGDGVGVEWNERRARPGCTSARRAALIKYQPWKAPAISEGSHVRVTLVWTRYSARGLGCTREEPPHPRSLHSSIIPTLGPEAHRAHSSTYKTLHRTQPCLRPLLRRVSTTPLSQPPLAKADLLIFRHRSELPILESVIKYSYTLALIFQRPLVLMTTAPPLASATA